jgi:hypothetical protein
MAAEGNLQTAPQGSSVERGDERLPRILHEINDIGKNRRLAGFAELSDIRAGDERPSFTPDNHGLHIRVGIALLHAGLQPCPHGLGQGVHWGIVDRNDSNIAFFEKLTGSDISVP